MYFHDVRPEALVHDFILWQLARARGNTVSLRSRDLQRFLHERGIRYALTHLTTIWEMLRNNLEYDTQWSKAFGKRRSRRLVVAREELVRLLDRLL